MGDDGSSANKILLKSAVVFILAMLFFLGKVLQCLPDLNSSYGQLAWILVGLISLELLAFLAPEHFRRVWALCRHAKMEPASLASVALILAWLSSEVLAIVPQHHPGMVQQLYFPSILLTAIVLKLGKLLLVNMQRRLSEHGVRLLEEMRLAEQLRTASRSLAWAMLILGVMFSVIAWLKGYALYVVVSKLVILLLIMSPTTLTLILPTAAKLGLAFAKKQAIFMKNPNTLEQISQLDMVIFDKTAALVKGKAELLDVVLLSDFNREQVLRLAASAEQYATHPIAKGLLNANKLELLKTEVQETVSGQGVIAHVADYQVVLGSKSLLLQQDVNCELEIANEHHKRLAHQGKSVIWLGVNGHLVALLALKDQLRDDAKAVVVALKRYHLNIAVLSGDNELSTRSIAEDAGIHTIFADVTANVKDKIITKLQAAGNKVGLVADGERDAAALAVADVGFAMQPLLAGAVHDSDVMLMNGTISSVAQAIRLVKLVVESIKNGIYFALGYNLVALFVATNIIGISMTALMAAMLMVAANIVSVLNVYWLKHRLASRLPSNRV